MPATRASTGAGLAGAGSLLGIATGVVQATVGSEIPSWTGAKAEPVPLGLLTVALSLVVAVATVLAVGERRPGARLLALAGLVLPALLCFTTVGLLWVPPGLLILGGAALLTREGRPMLRAARTAWPRVLVGGLGACEALMSAGSSPAVMTVGLVGGAALVVGAVIAPRRRTEALALLTVGTVPFGVLAWSAFVPVLLTALVVVLAGPALRRAGAGSGPGRDGAGSHAAVRST